MRAPSKPSCLVTGVAVAILLGACTGGAPHAADRSPEPTGAPPPPASPSPRGETFVRSCDSSVYGDLGQQWRRYAVVGGPIAFVGVSARPRGTAADLAPVGGRYRAVKMLAVVDRGSEVTVSVMPALRGHVALLYDPSAFRDDGLYSLADGETSVAFHACGNGQGSPGPTQFNGGLIVDGPRCVSLEVTSGAEMPRTVFVSLGGRRCDAR